MTKLLELITNGLKTKKLNFSYVLAISLVATVILINETLQFTELMIKHKNLWIFALLIFYFFLTISMEEKIWRKK